MVQDRATFAMADQ